MKNFKFALILTLSLIMIFSLAACKNDNKTEEKTYTITEAYQYPRISTNDSLRENIEKLQIPEDILRDISTDALIETVINYPRITPIALSTTHQEGFDSVYSYFNGLQELCNRSDAVEKMSIFIDKMDTMDEYDGRDNLIARIILKNLKTEEKPHIITKAYQYPIIPGTAEWEEFKTLDEMVEACQIPEDILRNIFTYALVETVINYPLAANMLAFDSPEKGYDSVNSYFNGLQELGNRSDAIEKMSIFIDKMDTMEDYDELHSTIARIILKNLKAEENNKNHNSEIFISCA